MRGLLPAPPAALVAGVLGERGAAKSESRPEERRERPEHGGRPALQLLLRGFSSARRAESPAQPLHRASTGVEFSVYFNSLYGFKQTCRPSPSLHTASCASLPTRQTFLFFCPALLQLLLSHSCTASPPLSLSTRIRANSASSAL